MGPGCEMTSVDEDLQVKWTFTLPEEGRLLKSFEFSRRQCSFVPARISTSQGSIILLLYLSADILRVRVVGVNANGSLFIIGDNALSLDIQVYSFGFFIHYCIHLRTGNLRHLV